MHFADAAAGRLQRGPQGGPLRPGHGAPCRRASLGAQAGIHAGQRVGKIGQSPVAMGHGQRGVLPRAAAPHQRRHQNRPGCARDEEQRVAQASTTVGAGSSAATTKPADSSVRCRRSHAWRRRSQQARSRPAGARACSRRDQEGDQRHRKQQPALVAAACRASRWRALKRCFGKARRARGAHPTMPGRPPMRLLWQVIANFAATCRYGYTSVTFAPRGRKIIWRNRRKSPKNVSVTTPNRRPAQFCVGVHVQCVSDRARTARPRIRDASGAQT